MTCRAPNVSSSLSTQDAARPRRPRRRRLRRPPRHSRTASRRPGSGCLPLSARHAGILDRPAKQVSQADLRCGQALRVLLRSRAAFRAGDGDSAAHGLETGCPYRRGLSAWKAAGGPVEASDDARKS